MHGEALLGDRCIGRGRHRRARVGTQLVRRHRHEVSSDPRDHRAVDHVAGTGDHGATNDDIDDHIDPVPDTSTSTSTTTTLAPPTTERQNTGAFDGEAFDAVVSAATMDVGDISVGIAVLRDGKVLHTAALGMEDPFQSRAATVDTRFRIASVSKIFTAVAIMQLVDEGSIELDEPFARQLGVDGPFTDPRIAAITVRQLMSHLSGFSSAHGIFFGHGVDTWQQAAQSALGEVLQADPGTAFQYSNTNFCLLGLLLEKVDRPTLRDRHTRARSATNRHRRPPCSDVRHPTR